MCVQAWENKKKQIQAVISHSQLSRSSHHIKSSNKNLPQRVQKQLNYRLLGVFGAFVCWLVLETPLHSGIGQCHQNQKKLNIRYTFKHIYAYIRIYMPMNICKSVCIVN